MRIRQFLNQAAFGPDDIAALSAAFEDAVRELGLDRADEDAIQTVAKRIIELAQQGERDPVRLRERAVKGI